MMHIAEPYRTETGVTVYRIGSEVKEQSGFVINRPQGSGDYDFIHFITEVSLRLDGRRFAVTPGTCILYGPQTPQWYSGDTRSFTHDWFHFAGVRAASLVEQSGVPMGQPFNPRLSGSITEMVRVMYTELVNKEPGWDLAIAAHLSLLFIRMQRAITSTAPRLSRAKAISIERLKDQRLSVHRVPEHAWTVGEMARGAGLSRSRFSSLYRRQFGVSPMDDVIRLRLERARWLLSNSSLTVTQIARQTGFEDAAYFNRLFSKRVGVSPGRYR
jgi:AraC family transcriptional regulator of arabinose operon